MTLRRIRLDAVRVIDSQIVDAAMAAARAIEEKEMEEAYENLESVRDMNKSMKEAAEIGELDRWIEYTEALADHIEETLCAIDEDRKWDAFEGALDIPELAKYHLGRS